MADEKVERLQSRRDQILKQLAPADLSTYPTNPAVRGLTAELATVESALIQAENTEALQREALDREQQRAERDDASFWLRRFILSLQLGNGAAIVASMSGLFQAKQMLLAVSLIKWPATLWVLGALLAGLVPGALWYQRAYPRSKVRISGWIAAMAAGSAIAFTIGLAVLIIEIRGLDELPGAQTGVGLGLPAPN